MKRAALMFATALAAILLTVSPAPAEQIQYVVHISVDGLRPDGVTSQSAAELPNFYRMRHEGSFTDNARTDVHSSVTLPNHIDQMTGRGVHGPPGASHNWSVNAWRRGGPTLHSNKGSYVAGVYDVAHDNGLRTGHYAGKGKFRLFDESWNAAGAAPDTTGEDNGRDKIDRFLYSRDMAALTSAWVSDMTARPQNYSFLHYRDPDITGHLFGWMSSKYLAVIRTIDGQLGAVFELVENHPAMRGRTAIIITADHGGQGRGHAKPLPNNYTIPLMVWGPGVPADGDLYAMNPTTRRDPGTGMPQWTAPTPPIRNGDVPNLALALLGLGAIPGSGINAAQDLKVLASVLDTPDARCLRVVGSRRRPRSLLPGRNRGVRTSRWTRGRRCTRTWRYGR